MWQKFGIQLRMLVELHGVDLRRMYQICSTFLLQLRIFPKNKKKGQNEGKYDMCADTNIWTQTVSVTALKLT